jgi:hypothetical protein
MQYYFDIGLKPYAYVTLTYVDIDDYQLKKELGSFIKELHNINEDLPRNTVPLQIHNYTPVKIRKNSFSTTAIKNQIKAVKIWNELISEF